MPAPPFLHLHPPAAVKSPTTFLPTKTPSSVPFRAWFHTASDKSLKVAAAVHSGEGLKALEGEVENGKEKVELSVERGSEVKPVLRMDRRQRGTSVVGNPDLLGIPGVGPRNSRKLA